jgi:cytochrome bd ubiquinol oxidase subunit I
VNALDISRWQFGIVRVYHFLFVPLTIGLAPLAAIMQTAWHRTGNLAWYRLTKFFGKLLLINFALGVPVSTSTSRRPRRSLPTSSR